MKRLLGGGLALGLAAVGSVAIAGPSLAQAPPEPEFVQLEGALSTDVAAPGQEITASSVDPCTVSEAGPGELFWLVFAVAEDLPRSEDEAPVGDDGHWEVTFSAPQDAGEVVCVAVGVPAGEEPPPEAQVEHLAADGVALSQAPTGDGGEEPEVIEIYELPFTVQAPPTTTPGQPVAPPATPVSGQPNFTG